MQRTSLAVARHARTALIALCAPVLMLTAAPVTPAAATPRLPAAAGDDALVKKLAKVLKSSRVTKATVGVVVADTASGGELYRRSSTTAISPASNMKLVTAAAALDLLGPNRRFSTSVFAAAKPAKGTVSRLYLRGYGDPTLREADLAAMARQVRSAGITRVSGSVIGDGGYFDNDRYNNDWNPRDYNSSYAAQVAGLTLAPSSDLLAGTIGITYKPGSGKGKKAKLGVVPASAAGYVKLVNKTRTTGAGTGASIGVRRTSGTNTITVTGRVALKRATVTRLVTVSNPARYAAHTFTNLLKKAGVSVGGTATTGKTPKSRVALAKDTSEPVSVLVRRLLKPSNNVLAEHLVKTMGRVGGKAGTWKAGSAKLRTWLKTTQSVPSTVRIVDGSGLAHSNKLTARVTVRLLQSVRKRSWFGTFYDALPVAGVSNASIGGTLRTRMVGTPAQGNLRAKTGTLNGVTALSGYVTGADGRLYTFSMLGRYRSLTPRVVFDQVGAALAGWSG